MSDTPLHPRSVYRAEHRRTVDADTVDVVLLPPARLRLLGFDAAELRGGTEEEEATAREQAAWVEGWLLSHPSVVADARGRDPFGRELAWVFDLYTGECLNLSFVLRWPETARNPRLQAQRITGVEASSRAQYKPRPA